MVIGTDGQDPIKPETAARILNDNLGERYDPDIVSVFLKAIEAEMGDLLEAEDPFLLPDKKPGGAKRRRPAPRRDEKLYDL